MYDNQKEIEEIERQIQEISPELRISSYGLDGNMATSVSTSIPIKGNGKVIKMLEELGWKKLYRKKVRTDNGRYARCQYEGYAMYQIMQLEI